MKKVMRIGKVDNDKADLFVRAQIKDGKLSLFGVVGPLPSGNAKGGCGQIEMEFAHRNPADDDKRFSHPTPPEEIDFAPGWDKESWFDLLEIWHRWHLNDLRAECEHQRNLGWTYESHHDPKTFRGEPCPVCGYECGSAWLMEELPAEVIARLESFPVTDTDPAWC